MSDVHRREFRAVQSVEKFWHADGIAVKRLVLRARFSLWCESPALMLTIRNDRLVILLGNAKHAQSLAERNAAHVLMPVAKSVILR